MDIAYLIRRGVSEHAHDPAVSCAGTTIDYTELHDAACRLANGLLGAGLRAGDRVAVLLENRLEYPVIDVALAYAGLVRVALNVRVGMGDFAYIVGDAGARALISEASFDEAATLLAKDLDLVWIRLDDEDGAPDGSHPYQRLLEASSSRWGRLADRTDLLAWISYTSGTTGRPKGVMLSHRALTQVAYNVMVELGVSTTASSILLPQPLSHGAGYFVLPYLACGGHVHIMRRFDPEQAVALGRAHHIRTLKLVPTMLLDILATGEAPSYQDVIYGAAPIAQPLLEEALDRYGPVLSQIYGQSEAPMTITYLSKEDHRLGGERLRSAGRPWRTAAVEVVSEDAEPVVPGDVGEVVVGGPHLMTGYFGQPELTAAALRGGWLWTRDLATSDEQGYIYLLGRTDDIINSGGFNVAPREVEDVVARFAGVREVAAVGVPDDRWGQAVRVYVVAEPGADLDTDALIEHCKPALGFRRPKSVMVVPHLPRTSYGKIDRARLGRDALENTGRL